MNLLFVLKHVFCNLLSVTVYRSCIKSYFLKSESFRVKEHNTIYKLGFEECDICCIDKVAAFKGFSNKKMYGCVIRTRKSALL